MKRRTFIKAVGSTSAVALMTPPMILKAAEWQPQPGLENSFTNPLRSDGPWVVWHWTDANQTKEGITANLEAMVDSGIAAANLFSFPPGGGTVVEEPAAPLTPEWFDLINHAVREAGRLGIALSMQISAARPAGRGYLPSCPNSRSYGVKT